MARLYRWLSDLPTVNARIALTLVLIVVVVVTWLVACVWLGKPEPGGLDAMLVFLATLSGVDALQYLAKRGTYKPGPPATPDVEDAKAGARVPVAMPPVQREGPFVGPRPPLRPSPPSIPPGIDPSPNDNVGGIL